MKKFILKILLVLLPIIILPFLYLEYFSYPPPQFSTSISFNAKIQNIKKHHLKENLIDVLAIGSSMSLNNIHTNTIKKNLGNKYLNVSSWGQNIEENYNLLKFFTKYYTPKKILLSSGYMDFNDSYKDINYGNVENYLFGNGICIYKELNLKYLLKESQKFLAMKNDTLNYTSLMYDDCGGVNFKNKGFNIDRKRWLGNSIKEFNLNLNQYNYLDSISLLCREKKIDLVFIQSPYRKGYLSQLDESSLEILNSHKLKIALILNKNKHLFITTENEVWEDTLFVDYSHFNSEGAKKYTEYFMNKIKISDLIHHRM